MNIKVYAGDTLAYDNLLPVEKGYTMQSILIRERKNTGGSATLLLPPNHPLRDGFPAFKTPVEIYRDGALRWRGRTLPESRDFYCRGKITCEGELCFLQDSTLRPGTYSGDLVTVFTRFIEAHNARVEEWKRFAVGNVTVTTGETVEITLQTGQKTYAEVQNLVAAYGGIIIFDSAPDGTRRINWYAGMPYSCNQQIALGANLTDYSSSVDVTGFATRIIPYGAEDSNGNPITINIDGKDYVENAEGVALRGIIEASVSYPDISDPEELRAAAQRDVDKAATLPETIKLSALDASRQDLSLEAFRVGQRIKAESAPHKLSGYYDLVAMEEDLVSPGAGGITLTKDSAYCDGAGSTLTGAVSSQGKQDFEKNHGASIASLTATILGANGGSVRLLDTDGDKLPDTLYVADNPDPTLAQIVWRFNYKGWAGSKNGYNGPFEIGATLEDGLLAKSFTSSTQVFLEPGQEEFDTIKAHVLGKAAIPNQALYDFDGSGSVGVTDMLLCQQAILGQISLAGWSGAVKSTVTVTIDPSDPERVITLCGTNMWGRYVEVVVGVNPSDGTFATKKCLQRMINQDPNNSYLYRTVDGETEYINPPMLIDVEYRTAERWNDKPVYKKLVDCGAGPAGTSSAFAQTRTSCGVDADKIVGCEVVWKGNGVTKHGASLVGHYNSDHTWVQNEKTVIVITSYSDMSELTAYVTLKYTKE